MQYRLLLALLAIGACALTAGCGGGGSDSTSVSAEAASSGREPGKSHWIAQADAICQKYQGEAAGIKSEYDSLGLSDSSSSEEIAEAARAGPRKARECRRKRRWTCASSNHRAAAGN